MAKCHCGSTEWTFSRICGVLVCDHCGNHQGLVLCYCGWALDGGDGYQQLLEAGENIEPD